MSDMTDRELKDCPFCGSLPTVSVSKDANLWSHEVVDWTTVSCADCDVAMRTRDGVEPDAIDAWNTRSDSAAETRAEKAERERDEARAKSAGYVEQIEQLIDENGSMRAELSTARCSVMDGVWFWQGEGDRPESLSCPVVMGAETLRAILTERDGFREERNAARSRASGLELLLHESKRSCDSIRSEVERLRGIEQAVREWGEANIVLATAIGAEAAADAACAARDALACIADDLARVPADDSHAATRSRKAGTPMSDWLDRMEARCAAGDACGTHAAVPVANLRRLIETARAAREYIAAHESRSDPNACERCGGERGEAHCCGPVHYADHKLARLKRKLLAPDALHGEVRS